MTRSFLPSLFGTGKEESPMFQSLHNEIDRVFDDFRTMMPRFGGEAFPNGNTRIVPKLDMSETENQVEITAELPGVKEDDIDVSVSGNILTLKGEKSASREEEKKDYRLVERSYGSFARSIPLAFDVDPKKVDAKFKDGVLTISVTKPPEIAAKTQKIKVSKAA